MNEHADDSELPELADEDVELLYTICKRAGASLDPPFKALFAAYDNVFAEQQIEQEHDGVVFRYLMRVGESTRTASRERRPVDLVAQLRNILEAHGVTIVEPSEDGAEDVAEAIVRPNAIAPKPFQSPRRRVSFDDARLEETWLSEQSVPLNTNERSTQAGLLILPPRRARDVASTRRARSTSSQRNLPFRGIGTKHSRRSSTDSLPEDNERRNPTLLFDPSQTQLEQNAEAYHATSTLRAARQSLHNWRYAALELQKARARADLIAVAHDRRTLLKQATNQWRESFEVSYRERNRLKQLKHLEEKATRCWNLFLLTKAFTHWATSSKDELLRVKVAQRYVLKVTYFKKWRAIAVENQMKVRKILARKYLAVWREKIARRLLWQEQATAHYEETLMRKCKTTWFWHFCSRRVQGWHEQWVRKHALHGVKRCFDHHQIHHEDAETFHRFRLTRNCLLVLRERAQEQRRAYASAAGHFDAAITAKGFRTLEVRAKLAPVERALTLRLNVNVESKVLKIWSLHLSLSQQAAEVDRKRILQTAWTNWNDALRCKALAQKIDERIVIENLYRWVLQERLKLFQRTADGKLLRRALGWCLSRVEEERDKLSDANVVFAERQRRRRLAYGMLRLNVAMRNREDAERAAIEFINGRTLPQVLEIWKERTNHARTLAKWAADARFYCLCTSALTTWHQKTIEHKQDRKRAAYAQVRARIKIRLVSNCFTSWRARTRGIQSMNTEAERVAQVRLTETCVTALHLWRKKVNRYAALTGQAAEADQQKLLRSAYSAMVVRHGDFAAMDQQALDYKQETDLAILAGALRRFRYATFRVAQKTHSAEALWLRNRDQHIKQMLRHWADQVVTRRVAGRDESEYLPENEPESPTLRPASRAASRSAHPSLPSSPPTQNALLSTPGYLRSPSRSRRAGRFRALPTPVPFTPMAFDSAYLVTTPAPLLNVDNSELEEASFGLTPQITPFDRKLRAGGITPAPPSAMRSSIFQRSTVVGGTGTNKSVRFAGSSRFRTTSDDTHEKTS